MHTLSLLLPLLFTSIPVLAVPHPAYGAPLSTSAAPIATPPSSSKPPIYTQSSSKPVAAPTSLSSHSPSAAPTSAPPSATLPAPTSAPTSSPIREVAGVWVCEHVYWGGKCEHFYRPTGTSEADCVALDGQTSSFGPDEGWTCVVYTNAFCRPLASDKSDFLEISYPGVDNLGKTSKGDLNDKIKSYACVKKT